MFAKIFYKKKTEKIYLKLSYLPFNTASTVRQARSQGVL